LEGARDRIEPFERRRSAAGDGIAAVARARLVVVAGDGEGSGADRRDAAIEHRAHVRVVARRAFGLLHDAAAAVGMVADAGLAGIVRRTAHDARRHARAALAVIVQRAGIAVVAGGVVGIGLARRRAAVAVDVIAVVAAFLRVLDAVAADLDRAVGATAVAGDDVAVVARLPRIVHAVGAREVAPVGAGPLDDR